MDERKQHLGGGDDTPPLNEPEADLTVLGVLRRGWFLFAFQGGAQVLAAVAGALPLALLFGGVLAFEVVPWYVGLVVFYAAFVLYLPSVFGALVCLTAAAHCGEAISVLTAYRRAWGRYGQLVLAFVGVYVGTVLGLYLLIVPGLWFLLHFGLAWLVVPIERSTVAAAFRRSNELLRGRRMAFLAVQLLFFLLNGLVAAVLATCSILWAAHLDQAPVLKFFVLAAFMELLVLPLVPYIPVLTAFYYDCVRRERCRRAGDDAKGGNVMGGEVMAASFELAPA